MKYEQLSTPRQLKSQQTKEKIFNATLDLLKKHGFEFLTVKNICKAAKVSNGTFFHYFKTKEELLAYYLSEGYNKYLTSLSHKNISDDFKERIINIYLYYAKYCEETGIDFISNYYTTKNKALCKRKLVESNIGTSEYTSIIYQTAGDLYRAQEAGYVQADLSPPTIAADICLLIKGIIFEWCLLEGDLDLSYYIRKMLTIYIDSVVTPKYRNDFPK